MGTCPLGLFRTALRSTLRTKAEVKSDLTVQSVPSSVDSGLLGSNGQ